jgi:hypothetical protein
VDRTAQDALCVASTNASVEDSLSFYAGFTGMTRATKTEEFATDGFGNNIVGKGSLSGRTRVECYGALSAKERRQGNSPTSPVEAQVDGTWKVGTTKILKERGFFEQVVHQNIRAGGGPRGGPGTRLLGGGRGGRAEGSPW